MVSYGSGGGGGGCLSFPVCLTTGGNSEGCQVLQSSILVQGKRNVK